MRCCLFLVAWFLGVMVVSTSPCLSASSQTAFESSDNPRSVEAIPRSDERVTLFWLPPRNGKVQNYRLFLDGNPVAEVPPEAKSYEFRSLEPGRTYRFGVQVLYEDGRISPLVERRDRPFRRLPAEARYPVVVVGGTASGLGAAITVARMGVKVALLEPTNRLGGMIANGVSITDVRNPARLSGLFAEFRQRVQAYYGGGDGLRYEPWVANLLLKEMAYEEPNLDLYFGVRPIRTLKRGKQVIGLIVESVGEQGQSRFYAQIVIDATVEGDVAAWAGAKFRIGREPRTPEEPHAGGIYYDRLHDRLLPGSTGKGDQRIQAYALMLTVKEYEEDRSTAPPPGYNPDHYRLAPPWEQSWAYLYGRVPNGKFEINQHPHGSDLQEENYRYPIASYEERQRIYERYKQHALGYLHYLQTVQGKRNLDLAEDEYRDHDHVPPILYVREARRIEGLVLFQEMDVIRARERPRPDAIAIGDYPMDSHAVQKVTEPDPRHLGEGEYWLFQYTPWYQVPYGVIVPKGVDGLLVASAVSATHVAYGTLRMEPVRMGLGQAAGAAAALSVLFHCQPSTLPVDQIQKRLLDFGVYLYWFPDVTPGTEHFKAVQFLAVKGYFPDENFRAEESLTRGEAARLIWKHLRTLEPSLEERLYEGLAYVDVPFTNPYAVAVANLYRLGVLEPTTSRRFEANLPVKRAEFARWLVKAMGLIAADWQPLQAPSPYEDVPDTSPDLPYLNALALRRINPILWDGTAAVSKEGVLFRPEAPISRADAAATLFAAYLGE